VNESKEMHRRFKEVLLLLDNKLIFIFGGDMCNVTTHIFKSMFEQETVTRTVVYVRRLLKTFCLLTKLLLLK